MFLVNICPEEFSVKVILLKTKIKICFIKRLKKVLNKLISKCKCICKKQKRKQRPCECILDFSPKYYNYSIDCLTVTKKWLVFLLLYCSCSDSLLLFFTGHISTFLSTCLYSILIAPVLMTWYFLNSFLLHIGLTVFLLFTTQCHSLLYCL